MRIFYLNEDPIVLCVMHEDIYLNEDPIVETVVLISPTNLNVLIYSNAIVMAVEGLQKTISDNNKEVLALLQRSLSLQGYPSSEGLCTPRGTSDAPRPCYQGGADAANSDPNETVISKHMGGKPGLKGYLLLTPTMCLPWFSRAFRGGQC